MAAITSFKQQCPSCEALVPIRDPKLIGRKIDCPKCKYRFVVEEPATDDAEQEGATTPKKGKGTDKKPANGKAKPGLKRRDDADDKPRKKGEGTSTTVIGLALAGVAVIALAIGAWVLWGGKKAKT